MNKIIWRSVKFSLAIGTILFLMNHYQLFMGDEMRDYELLQILLTYLVPFGVSYFSSRCEYVENMEKRVP